MTLHWRVGDPHILADTQYTGYLCCIWPSEPKIRVKAVCSISHRAGGDVTLEARTDVATPPELYANVITGVTKVVYICTQIEKYCMYCTQTESLEGPPA